MELYAVRIFVRQWANACAFYGVTLGLKERFRNDDVGWAEYDLGGPCIGLEHVTPDNPEAEALVGRFVGISLRVENLEEIYKSLQGKGVLFSAPPEKQQWGESLAHFEDPDGNILTLLG